MKIIIVGGGMTGWITAFVMATRHPDISFTVLDYRGVVPSIGVGEGTTGYFLNAVIKRPGKFTLKEFLKETKSTPKLGILFEDWDYEGHKYLSPIDSSVTKRLDYDYSTVFDYTQSLNNDEYIFGEKSSALSNLRKKGLTPFYRNSEEMDYYDTALHLDNQLTIEFLKKQSLKLDNVECLETGVWKQPRNRKGITELITNDGKKLSADLYLDCTGFKRILSQNVKWKSFEKELFVNSVFTFEIEGDGNPDLVTKAKAEKHGWMWTIPTQERYGCGYLYSDKHISHEEATDYVRDNYYVGRFGKSFSFNPGKLVKSWNKNVVSLGLSYHFLEPLQATSIHLLLTQLDLMDEYYFSKSDDAKDIKKYNIHIDKVIDNYKDFVALHYSGKRNDTSFWKKVSRKSHLSRFTKKIIKACKRGLYNSDFDNILGSTGRELWHYTILGMNHLSLDECFQQLNKHDSISDANNILIENNRRCNPEDFITYQEFLDKLNS